MRNVAILLVFLAAPGWAASALDGLRAQVAQAQDADAQLSADQGRLSAELDQLGARISQLKAHGRKLVANGELDQDLRRSQELSSRLNALSAQRQGSADALTRARLALAQGLGDELSRLRQEWDHQGSRDARAQLVARMRAVRHEREQVLAAMPASALPSLPPVRASDDPEDLLEQADAARDAQDKVQRRLAALNERIAEAKQERELESRLSEFSADQGAFDEQDRSLRLNQDPHARTAQADSFSAAPQLTPQAGGASNGPGAGSGLPEGPGAPVPTVDTNAPRSGHDGAGDDLQQLEREKAQLDQLNRDLADRAKSLEQKAQQLR